MPRQQGFFKLHSPWPPSLFPAGVSWHLTWHPWDVPPWVMPRQLGLSQLCPWVLCKESWPARAQVPLRALCGMSVPSTLVTRGQEVGDLHPRPGCEAIPEGMGSGVSPMGPEPQSPPVTV